MNENTTNTKTLQFELDPATGRLTNQSASRYFSRFGWFAFTMAIILEVLVIVADIVFTKALPNVRSHFAFGDVLSFVTIYAIAFPIAFIFLKKLPYEKPIPVKMPFGKFFIGFCICMALMTIGSNVSQTILSLIEGLSGTTTENPVEVMVSSTPWWFNLLTTVILAPILEELVFRKIVCDRLAPLGEGFAIMLSAAFFGLFHGNLYQLFYAFLLGAFLGFIYIKTGKIKYTIFYHMLVNFFGGFLTPLVMKLVDFEQLYSEDMTAWLENPSLVDMSEMLTALPGLMLFMLYENILLAFTVLGVVMAIVKRREFKVNKGLLQPPKKWGGPLFFNGGIAAAITILCLILVWSLA